MTLGPPTLVFLDLETGGPNPKRHPILQLAAVAAHAVTLEELASLELKLVFDERRANRYSLRKANYSRRRWQREAVDERQAARQLAAFLRRHASYPVAGRNGREFAVAELVAHNAPFDEGFLAAWYKRLGLFCPARFPVLCTLQRARWFFAEYPDAHPPDNFKLTTLCRRFELPSGEAHDALADAHATRALYCRLRDTREASPLLGGVGQALRRTDAPPLSCPM